MDVNIQQKSTTFVSLIFRDYNVLFFDVFCKLINIFELYQKQYLNICLKQGNSIIF